MHADCELSPSSQKLPTRKTKFLVFVQTFNSVEYLAHCLDSILSQEFEDFVVLIFDDASMDGSKDMILRYAESQPERVFFYFARSNSFDCRNLRFLLLKDLEFDYFLVCDADDAFGSTTKLSEYSLAAGSANEPAIIYSKTTVVGDGEHAHHHRASYQRNEQLLASNGPFGLALRYLTLGMSTPSIAIRKDAIPFGELEQNPRIFPTDLILKCRAREVGKAIYIPKPLSEYRVRDDASWAGLSMEEIARLTRSQLKYLWVGAPLVSRLRILYALTLLRVSSLFSRGIN